MRVTTGSAITRRCISSHPTFNTWKPFCGWLLIKRWKAWFTSIINRRSWLNNENGLHSLFTVLLMLLLARSFFNRSDVLLVIRWSCELFEVRKRFSENVQVITETTTLNNKFHNINSLLSFRTKKLSHTQHMAFRFLPDTLLEKLFNSPNYSLSNCLKIPQTISSPNHRTL